MTHGCKRAGGFVDSGCCALCDCHEKLRIETPAATPVAADLSKDDKCALQIFKLVTDQTERIARLVRQCDALHKSYNLAIANRLEWRREAEAARIERDALALQVLTLTNERDDARALARCC